MNYNLFLDDRREPKQCRHFPGDESSYDDEEWIVVRSFNEFCNTINEHGLPKLVSFDYDLGLDKTGIDCAKFLKDYCQQHELSIPEYLVHSNWPGIKGDFYEILK